MMELPALYRVFLTSTRMSNAQNRIVGEDLMNESDCYWPRDRKHSDDQTCAELGNLSLQGFYISHRSLRNFKALVVIQDLEAGSFCKETNGLFLLFLYKQIVLNIPWNEKPWDMLQGK